MERERKGKRERERKRSRPGEEQEEKEQEQGRRERFVKNKHGYYTNLHSVGRAAARRTAPKLLRAIGVAPNTRGKGLGGLLGEAT